MEEKQYVHLVEHFPDGILIFTQGCCSYINETGMQLLGGSSKDSFIGKSLYEWVPEIYQERLEKRIKRIEREVALGPAEEQLVCHNGDILDVEVRILSSEYQGEEVLYVLFRDIADRKKAEAFLMNSEKLTVAGQLAANIAHDVRDPLISLRGFFQIMESDIKEKKPYLDVVHAEINRIEIILSELLVLAKPQEAKMAPHSLYKILTRVVTLFQTQTAMHDVKLKTRLERNLPTILCDANQLKQVFLQLLKNAAEAMRNEGEISLQAERHSTDQMIIHFIDQGCGISDEQIKRLGEPFFTTKENAAGLGLMMAFRIIENHHGSIRIASSPQGTTVGVILPIKDA